MTPVDEWVAAQLAKTGPLTEQQKTDLRRLLLPQPDQKPA